MLQRIQTVFLLFAATAMALCFAYPIAQFTAHSLTIDQVMVSDLNLIAHDCPNMGLQISEGSPIVEVSQRGLIKTWPLVTLALLGVALGVVAILLYRNRVLQARVAMGGFLVSLVYFFLVLIWAVDDYGKTCSVLMGTEAPSVSWTLGTWLPVVAMLFFFLAQKAIRKDEAKVRAADRLR
ncbi:MAG: DUF4293 domain-containing protein [Bacteroidales bacterium]|nr:DUF4293 domain-containing protein [Candidatus Colimorpha onthohippi]